MHLSFKSPSQTNYRFESFLKNVKLTLDKFHEEITLMISVLGDFNAIVSVKLILIPKKFP